MQTTTRPEPSPSSATPRGWPPRENGPVLDHVRRHLAWYVLGGLLALAAGGAVAVLVVLERFDQLEALIQGR